MFHISHSSRRGAHKKNLVSRPLKIEKVMCACDFYSYFLSFLQGQIEIFVTGIILLFLHIMDMSITVTKSWHFC